MVFNLFLHYIFFLWGLLVGELQGVEDKYVFRLLFFENHSRNVK